MAEVTITPTTTSEPIVLEAPVATPAPVAEPAVETVAAQPQPEAAGFINIDNTTYTTEVNLGVPALYPTGFEEISYGWDIGVLAPYNKQGRGQGGDGFILNTNGSGTIGTPGSSTSLQVGIRQWNLELTGGFSASPADTDADGVIDGTDEVPTLNLAWTKYRTVDGAPDLNFPLYKIKAGFVGANQFSTGISTNVPVGPTFIQGAANYSPSRSDAEFFFDGLGSQENTSWQDKVITQNVSVNGSVLFNLGDFKSQNVSKAAMKVNGSFAHNWDDDVYTEDATSANVGAMVAFPLWKKDLSLSDVARGRAPLSLSVGLSYGRSYMIDGWFLPSTGETVDPFTGVDYDPAFYRGEEELAPNEIESNSWSGSVALGGALFSIPIANKDRFSANLSPSIGMNFSPESPVDPFIGVSLVMTGNGKVKAE